MKRLLVAAVVVGGMLAASISSADAVTLTTYTDRAAYMAAAGNPAYSENFNSITTDQSLGTTPLELGSIKFSVDPSAFLYVDAVPLSVYPGLVVDGTTLLSVSATIGSVLTVQFDQPVLAFGADLGSLNDGQARTNIRVLGETLTTPVVDPLEYIFFGIVSDTPFSTITFESFKGDTYSLDNIAISPIPLPGGVWLLLSALSALGFADWRSKKSPIICG